MRAHGRVLAVVIFFAASCTASAQTYAVVPTGSWTGGLFQGQPVAGWATEPSAGPVCDSGPGFFNPTMFGDLIGVYQRVALTKSPALLRQVPAARGGPNRVAATTAITPLYGRGGFKISENESPRPLDRVFITYNYFNNVVAGDPVANVINNDVAVHRETIGFEKTFLDRNASFGMRLPFVQFLNGTGRDGIGDLTLIGKYALINDRTNGNILSTGLALTVPTGVNPYADIGLDTNSVLLQPYVGYIFNANRWYLHGFSSIVAPTDARDATLMFNDVGVGYWLYRSGAATFLTAVVPTLEAHVTTPFNHRGLDNPGPIGVPDIVSLTGGATFLFNGRSSLGAAVGVPVTGPRPYSFETLLQFNWLF